DLAHVAHGLDDIAGAGFALGADHRRTFTDAAQRFPEVSGTAHEWHREPPLVDVMRVIRWGEHFALVDVVDLERLQHLRFHTVADTDLGHHGNGHRFLDADDHFGVAHTRDAPIATDVGGYAFQRHHRAGPGVLGDLCLL